MSYKSGAAVGPSLCAVDSTVTRPTPVRCCQLSREGRFTGVDRSRKPMGREEKKVLGCLIFGTRTIRMIPTNVLAKFCQGSPR